MDNGLFLGTAVKYVQEMSELINYALTHSVCYQTVISLDLAPQMMIVSIWEPLKRKPLSIA